MQHDPSEINALLQTFTLGMVAGWAMTYLYFQQKIQRIVASFYKVCYYKDRQ